MSYSGDAAEQVVRMSLETGEVAVRLAGSGAKQLAILLYAILREQKKTAGKARLTKPDGLYPVWAASGRGLSGLFVSPQGSHFGQ